jgi:hypothetical protein
VVGAQPPERIVSHLSDPFGPTVSPVARPSVGEPELGGDHDAVADRLQCLSDEVLVAALAVGLGGVEERDAAVVCMPEQGDQRLNSLVALATLLTPTMPKTRQLTTSSMTSGSR